MLYGFVNFVFSLLLSTLTLIYFEQTYEVTNTPYISSILYSDVTFYYNSYRKSCYRYGSASSHHHGVITLLRPLALRTEVPGIHVPLKSALHVRGSGPPSNTWFSETTGVLFQATV